MPSPPAAVSASHQAMAAAQLVGVVEVNHAPGRRRERSAGSARRAARASSMCQTWSLSTWTLPSVASRWNGASRRSSSDADRPAVAAVGVDVKARAAAARAEVAAASAATSTPRAAVRASSASASREAGARPRRRPAAYWPASSACALADHGISSASRQTQSVSNSSQNPARPSAARTRSSSAASSGGVGEERPAGAGVDDPGRVRRRRSAGARRRRRGRRSRRRASPCASPRRRPAPTPCAAVVGEGFRGMLEQPRARGWSPTATWSAAGRSASCGSAANRLIASSAAAALLLADRDGAVGRVSMMRLPSTSPMSSVPVIALPGGLAIRRGEAAGPARSMSGPPAPRPARARASAARSAGRRRRSRCRCRSCG